MNSVLDIYGQNAKGMSQRYDADRAEDVLAPVMDLLPARGRMLDVGAGSGRDVQWFAARGFDVIAAEPVAEFRTVIEGKLPGIEVLDASLPELAGVTGQFDLILANAVLHHLPSGARRRGYARMATLLARGGQLLISLRQGPEPKGDMVFALDGKSEIEMAETAGLTLVRMTTPEVGRVEDDKMSVLWTWLVLTKEMVR